MLISLLSLVCTATSPVLAPLSQGGPPAIDPVPGHWNAWLTTQGQRLPFGLEIERGPGGDWRAWITNAEERIELADVGWRDGQFRMRIPPFDSHLSAYVVNQGERMKGMWERRRGTNVTRLEFGAIAGEPERFPLQLREPLGSAKQHVGRWAVQFESSDEPAVAELVLLPDGRTRGTILTTSGDYRYLEGAFDGSNLYLSAFDGSHAFLLEASLQPDGGLIGTFYSGATWEEGWTARRDPEADLPDALGLSTWTGAVPLGDLRYPDLEGEPRPLDDPAFAGRAQLLVLFGSWCPNCHDESRYLVELDRRYRDRGLSIVGLAFEFDEDPAQRARAVREYAERVGIEYPLLVAGPADKTGASEAFPLLDRVRAYPTTIFLDASGAVRAVYTGFSGPATGPAYARLRERFEELVEELLAED